MVWWMEKGRYTQARVVFRSVSASDDSVELALEFNGCDDFWGMDFSNERASQHPKDDPALQLLRALGAQAMNRRPRRGP
jgi:hypothetical protein